MVSGPTVRATAKHTVSFTCESHGFSPRDITLKWFKNGNELSDFQTSVDPAGQSMSYSIPSTARVVLTRRDVHSQVICEVAHVTLQGDALRGTANLSEAIRGRRPLPSLSPHLAAKSTPNSPGYCSRSWMSWNLIPVSSTFHAPRCAGHLPSFKWQLSGDQKPCAKLYAREFYLFYQEQLQLVSTYWEPNPYVLGDFTDFATVLTFQLYARGGACRYHSFLA